MKRATGVVFGAVVIFIASLGNAYAADPVTITFDNLPTNTNVTNQYSQVTFSANGFSAGAGGPYGNNLYARSFYKPSGYSNGIVSEVYSYYYYPVGDVFLDFPIPVNNLNFYIYNSVGNYGDQLCYIYVYVDHNYYGSYPIQHNPYGPIFVNQLSGISNITGIYIGGVWNYYQPLDATYPIYYDDFTFTPNLNVSITSARVSGILNGTTQNALLGADVALNANINPSNLTGGTYSWSVTGPNQQVSGSSTSSSYTVRWTEPGTYQTTVTYSRNGVNASATINVNVLIPKLTSYTAIQAADRITADQCGGELPPLPDAFYVLGCPPSPWGITYSATAQVPSGSYLTDPFQGGIKFVQILSAFRKELSYGKVRCLTARNTESNTESGWQLDTVDPYLGTGYSVTRFHQGNTLTTQDVDSPRMGLVSPGFWYNTDAYELNEVFETYVVYFTGSNPSSPIFQRAIGLQGSPKPVARIAWSWGGTGVYDVYSPHSYRQLTTLVPARSYAAEAVDAMRPYSGNVQDLVFQQCPSGPAVSNNPIDGSRFFVGRQYCDILQRQPDSAWLHWISQITQCGFNQPCIDARRVAIARGFYESPEFRNAHPNLLDPGAQQYNEEYVLQLYRTLLLREGDSNYQFWVNYLNTTSDYDGVVYGFLYSTEYRNRFSPGMKLCWE